LDYFNETMTEFDSNCSSPEWKKSNPVQQTKGTDLAVWPTPASDVVNIENKSNRDLKLTILDSRGQLMKTIPLDQVSTINLKVASWPAGIYFINDNLGNTTKFIIVN